jgi:poly-gamma-glutamate synthesis protein (capsule biosynthesis protein)
VRTIRGLRFGFLAFNGVGEWFDRQSVATAIRQADPQVDVLAVSFHWGKEYESLPQADQWLAPDDPIEIAHLAVDAGADLIIGNHPHWVQAVELYKGKLIAYAHGNFIFDQMWSPEVRRGVLGRYTFYDQHLVRAEYLPVLIEDYWQPRFLAGNEAQALLNSMYQASRTLEASLQNNTSAQGTSN